MPGKILAGTASWTDPGFIAEWYPPDLRAADRLRWYADHFSLVEVNSSFYGIPDPSAVKKWCQQTPPNFIFNVKLHRLLSRHSTRLELLPPILRPKAVVEKGRVKLTPSLEKAMAKRFLRAIRPFEQAGKLGALLLQLSPAFSPRHHTLPQLDQLFELLEGYSVAVELRNRGWATPENLPETKDFFTRRKIVFVMVDGPDDPHFMVLPNVDVVTSRELAYIRAHGRNARGYVRGRTVADRFDYDYPEGELREIAKRAVSAAQQAKEVHVIYNNNKADYAPRAAMVFQRILRKQHPETLATEVRQKELAYG